MALSACTPTAGGVCEADTACKPDELCHEGLCIKRALLGDGGQPDSGSGDAGQADSGTDGGDGGQADSGTDGGDGGEPDAGGVDAGCLGTGCELGLLIQRPHAGAAVGATVHVEAQASSSATPDDVTFSLVTPVGSTTLASARVTAAGPGQLYAADLVVGAAASGDAVLHATLHVGGRSLEAATVAVVIDQVAPTISTSWSGGPWRSAAGTFTVPAIVVDNQGVGSAQLSVALADGGTARFAAALSGGNATFTVPAAGLALAGAAIELPFTLSAVDTAGNSFTAPAAAGLVLRVDDEKPSVSAAVDGVWHSTSATFTATATDHAGAGVDPASYAVAGLASSTAVSGGGGSAVFTLDLTGLPATQEGPVTLQVLASDLAGNQGDAGVTLLVDRVPPAITAFASLSSPDQGPWFRVHAGGDIVVQASIDGGAGSPLDLSSLSVDAGFAVPRDPTKPDYTFLVARDAGTGLEGPLTLQLSAHDLAGNIGTATTTINFDDRPPTLDGGLFLPDGGTWIARRLADGGPAPAQLTVAASDLGVGVKSLEPLSADGVTSLGALATAPSAADRYTLAFSVAGAPAAAAGAFGFSVRAKDNFDNTSSHAYSVQVDDAPPVITQSGVNVDNGWHSGLPGSTTSQVTPIVTIADEGSGVAGAPTLTQPSGAQVSTAHLLSGGTNLSGRWQFDAFTVPADAALNGQVVFTARAADGVGNVGTSGSALKIFIDNQPPTISAVTYARDTGSATFLRGPSVALAGDPSTIDVSMLLVEDNLLPGSPTAAIPGTSTPLPATFNAGDGRYHFAIPRSLGLGGGVKNITLTAIDKALNVTPFGLDLPFDDSAATFTVNADSTWFSRSGAGLSVVATVTGAVPASGIGTATLIGSAGGAGCTLGPASSTANVSYTFSLPRTCAPAGAEGPYSFTVKLTSGANVPGVVTSTRNIDDKPPTVSAWSAPAYPAPAGGPLGYSHDGSHFNLADGNVSLGSFTAYDCGVGLFSDAAHLPAFSIVGSPSTRAVAVANTGQVQDCGGGRTAPIFSFAVSADFRTATAWAYGVDAAPLVTVNVADLLGQVFPAQTTANVTRRRWSIATAAAQLAVGPGMVFAGSGNGLVSIDRPSGNIFWSHATALASGPSVSPNGGNPVVFYAEQNGQSPRLVGANANAGTYAEVSACTPVTSGADPDSESLGKLVLQSNGNAAGTDFYTHTTQRCSPTGCDTPPCCSDVTVSRQATVGLGGSGGCSTGIEAHPSTVVGALSSYDLDTVQGKLFSRPGTSRSALSGASSAIVAASGSNDAVFADDGFRFDYNGSSFAAPVNVGLQALAALSTESILLGLTGATYVSRGFGGQAVAGSVGTSGSSGLIVDGARPRAVAYLTGVAGLNSFEAREFDTSAGLNGNVRMSVGSLNGNINDLVLAADGTLYVATGVAVYAFITDSPGVGTQSGGPAVGGWPAPGRDACKSFNLSFPCPY